MKPVDQCSRATFPGSRARGMLRHPVAVGDTSMRRRVLLRGAANPFDPAFDD